MATIATLLSQYPILSSLASSISTLDLFNLARTCKANYFNILPSRHSFDVLKRRCLCDGHGLANRQNQSGLYSPTFTILSHLTGKVYQDDPIEVRLYNIKCEAQALPCCKCGINVCEECRYYQREPPRKSGYPGERRPHLNAAWETEDIMCLCRKCDNNLETELKGKFLNELCDCDVYHRWICVKCATEEMEFSKDYFDDHTVSEHDKNFEGYWKRTKMMSDHGFDRAFSCLCGGRVPKKMRPRCTWCKRRHLPEGEWYQEWERINRTLPVSDNHLDTCYPLFEFYAADRSTSRLDSIVPTNWRMYPKLPYGGPIWKA